MKLLLKFITFKIIFLGFSLLVSVPTFATTYYINDKSIQNDVFTTAIGQQKNDGLSPTTPKNSIQEVYQLSKPGDIIYVDYGTYPEINPQGNLAFSNDKQITFIFYFDKTNIQEKIALLTQQKINPEEFYIVNDKPVDRATYLLWLQSTSSPKK